MYYVSVSAKDIINSLSTDNRNRFYHPEDLLLIANNTDGLSIHHICADNSDFSSLADTTITEHQARLHRQLATFNRIIHPSAKDGDCAFRSAKLPPVKLYFIRYLISLLHYEKLPGQ